MQYLREQYRSVCRALGSGLTVEDALPIKAYVQRQIAEQIASLTPPGSAILEVGVGGSMAIHYLSNLGFRCTAVDADPFALEFSKLLSAAMKSSVALKMADAAALPFTNRQFEYVYSVGMIEHYPVEVQEALAHEMKRCASAFVHLEIPNYAPDSAFHPVYVSSNELHYPCNLQSLMGTLHLDVIDHDGRCIFVKQELLKQNEKLAQFIGSVDIYRAQKEYTASDIDYLMGLERSISRSDRLRFGYQVYMIGAHRSASLSG